MNNNCANLQSPPPLAGEGEGGGRLTGMDLPLDPLPDSFPQAGEVCGVTQESKQLSKRAGVRAAQIEAACPAISVDAAFRRPP
jgi:hypothetical protein